MKIGLAQKPDRESQSQSVIKTQRQEPLLYNVVLLNDDYTPMDFVIEVLMHFFSHQYDDAYHIMMMIHQRGQSVAGTFPREIAIEKCKKVIDAAKANEFPLNCEIEPQTR